MGKRGNDASPLQLPSVHQDPCYDESACDIPEKSRIFSQQNVAKERQDSSRPVVLKVGGIIPWGVIEGQGGDKTKRSDRGKNNTKGSKMFNH